MLSIIEKVKGLFKCGSEKNEQFAPQQEEPKPETSEEEQPSPSSEETASG